MWIVRLALRRPYTFVVASLLLLLLTPFVLLRTPTDIFPAINIPVVSVVWQYTGLSAKDIEQRMVYTHERALTTTVNNIQHIESTSYDGIGVIKIFFQPGVSPDGAVAEVTAESQTVLKQMPPGTTPPLIIQYSASTVPILQYGISSKALSEQQVFDVAMNTIRVGLISVPGGSCSWRRRKFAARRRSEEHTSELQSLTNLVCRLLLEKKKKKLFRMQIEWLASSGQHRDCDTGRTRAWWILKA